MSTNHTATDSVPLEALRSIALFKGFEPGDLERLAALTRSRRTEPGEVVCVEGAVSDEMFVVLQGEFEVLKRSQTGVETRIAMLGQGDWFGEMSVLEATPRSATIRALAVSNLVVISRGCLADFRKHAPQAYVQFVVNIAKRLGYHLRVADAMLANRPIMHMRS